MARPDQIDAGTAYIRDEVMPTLQELPGSIGLSLMVDRESGRCIATSAWESEDALHYSAGEGRRLRNLAAERFGGGAPLVEEWEIAVLHRERGNGACVRATCFGSSTLPIRPSRGLKIGGPTTVPSQ